MDSVIRSFSYCLAYIREQVADLTNEQMVIQRKSLPNHAAWTLGHLAASCQALGGEIGIKRWLPDDWSARYGYGSTPAPDVTVYETKDELLEILLDSERRLINRINELTEAQLGQPLPDENYRDELPAIQDALVQMLVAHTANHIGQLTIWRRMAGLPKIERPFL